MMFKQHDLLRAAGALALLTAAGSALAAGGDLGELKQQPTNWTAIIMFGVFVLATLWITKWAASKTKSAADFYTAGGGITGFYVRRANSEFDRLTREIVEEVGK